VVVGDYRDIDGIRRALANSARRVAPRRKTGAPPGPKPTPVPNGNRLTGRPLTAVAPPPPKPAPPPPAPVFDKDEARIFLKKNFRQMTGFNDLDSVLDPEINTTYGFIREVQWRGARICKIVYTGVKTYQANLGQDEVYQQIQDVNVKWPNDEKEDWKLVTYWRRTGTDKMEPQFETTRAGKRMVANFVPSGETVTEADYNSAIGTDERNLPSAVKVPWVGPYTAIRSATGADEKNVEPAIKNRLQGGMPANFGNSMPRPWLGSEREGGLASLACMRAALAAADGGGRRSGEAGRGCDG